MRTVRLPAQGGAGLAAATLGLTLLLAGCGGNDSTSSGGAYGGGNSTGQGTRIMVDESDFTISSPRMTLKPGTYTFVAKNNGHTQHALEVEGEGLEEETDTTNPGESASVTVTLEKGTYELYCPVDGHKAKGMHTEITVE